MKTYKIPEMPDDAAITRYSNVHGISFEQAKKIISDQIKRRTESILAYNEKQATQSPRLSHD